MRVFWIIALALVLGGCATKDVFKPRSQYPPDPWVKSYSNSDDCLGGWLCQNIPDVPLIQDDKAG